MLKRLYLCVEIEAGWEIATERRVFATLLPLLSWEWDLVEEVLRLRQEEAQR